MTGVRVGNWVLGAEIGRGPLGVVYRAVAQDEPDRVAAVKVLTHESTRSPAFLERFPAEMLSLRRLNHPNISAFYDSGVSGGFAFYASELIEGTDLTALLKSRPKKPDEPGLSWKEDLFRIGVPIARALKHGHHRSILHRDLTPGNVRIAIDGTVKLTDFGVAKVFNLPPLSLEPNPWGTAGFLAPEHFTGKPLTRRSDLYSFGGVLYALLAGRPPFSATSAAEFLHKHCYTLPDHPVNFAPKMPPDLDDLICGLLNKDPARRPPSAAAVLEGLDQIRAKLERKGVMVSWPSADSLDGTGLEAALAEHPPTGEREDLAPPRPLMSRPWVVGPLFALVIAAMLAGVFWPSPKPEDLYAAAQPLLASENPDDWDRAWDEYLEPLSRKYPDQYAAEVRAAREKMLDYKELRRAMQAGSRVKYGSEAERWYQLGLRQVQAGDPAAARRTWESLVRGFAGVPTESRWVGLATEGLEELAKKPNIGSPTPPSRATLTEALKRIRERPLGERDAAVAALTELYRDDASALESILAVK